jgi:hypothetical protein
MLVMKNCKAIGNGGDGLRLGSGIKAEITGFTAYGNGGRGAYIAHDAEAKITDFIATKNAGGGIEIGDIEDLVGVCIPKELRVTVERAIQEASSQADAEDKLKRSGFGQWLKEQRAADWLNIVATIASAAWTKM